MTTWRGCTCSVGYCDRRASLQIHVLPLCHEHGMEVTESLSDAIISKYKLDQRVRMACRVEQSESKRGNREGGRVYYARIGDYIKIGYSARLRNRLETLRVDEVLAVEPGDPALERVRHKEFAAERIDRRRENFRPSERLTEHIAALREEHGLPKWAALPRTSAITIRTKGDQ